MVVVSNLAVVVELFVDVVVGGVVEVEDFVVPRVVVVLAAAFVVVLVPHWPRSRYSVKQ